jgi:hypothetical protein
LRPAIVILLSVIALLLLASSLLADDGTTEVDETSHPDTTAVTPISLIGVTSGFDFESEPDFKHSTGKSVLFSTIAPGLGQAQNGRWAKASAFVVVGSLLVTKIIVESQRADRYLYLSRQAATNAEAEALYDGYVDHFDRRGRLIWWAVGFWVYNMFDAYIDAHLFDFSRQ